MITLGAQASVKNRNESAVNEGPRYAGFNGCFSPNDGRRETEPAWSSVPGPPSPRLVLPTVFPPQFDEPAVRELILFKSRCSAFDPFQGLAALITKGYDQSAIDGKLIEKGFGQAWRRGRD